MTFQRSAVLLVLAFIVFGPGCSDDAAVAPSDGKKNGTETDVDCGGAGSPKCPDSKHCNGADDCQSGFCKDDVCTPITCEDALKNGTETDVDCGGSCPAKCADLQACSIPEDCTSGVCNEAGGPKQCQVPSPTDAVKNGTESDVDCGGVETNPRCAIDKGCNDHADCESDACNHAKKCIARKSCTGHFGGDTCGLGGEGGRGAAQWESCCVTAPAGAGGVAMDKYQVTAGRMRAFLERVKGNVRQVVKDARAAGALHGAVMPASYDLFLPTSMEGCDQKGDCGPEEISDYLFEGNAGTAFQGVYTSAYRFIGGDMFHGQNLPTQGCRVDSPGTHTYWMSNEVQANYFGDAPAEHPQEVYDTKSLNCVPYLMAQAFCIWDGGRLESQAEFTAAGGSANYGGAVGQAPPWGTPTPVGRPDTYIDARYPSGDDASLGIGAGGTVEWANYLQSYEYPGLKSTDYVVFIAAPGRHKYRSTNGHADLVGNVMEITNDVNNQTGDPRSTNARWSANGSFEGHQWGFYDWNFTLVNKYGKQGARCVFPD
jgi:formylglycine-generating enzyme required for sulfatase activity